MNRLVILSLALAALTAVFWSEWWLLTDEYSFVFDPFLKQSASGRASKECGATEAVQWLACCPIPLKNGVLLETTCPRDFSISDSAAAKTCYYDCAYKENGLIMDDGTLIRDKIEEYSKNYFAGHPEYQDTVSKAVEMAFEKSKTHEKMFFRKICNPSIFQSKDPKGKSPLATRNATRLPCSSH